MKFFIYSFNQDKNHFDKIYQELVHGLQNMQKIAHDFGGISFGGKSKKFFQSSVFVFCQKFNLLLCIFLP